MRVLVADDFEPFLELANEVVAGMPEFEPVREVGSGEEAVAAAAELKPDLMIVDVHMPDTDGIEVARRVSANDPKVVIALISARGSGDIPATALESGAACVLRKQEFGPELLSRVWDRYGRSRE